MFWNGFNESQPSLIELLSSYLEKPPTPYSEK